MVQRHSPDVPSGVPILAISFLACAATGLELSINNQFADFPLSTKLGYSVSLSCLVHNSSQAEQLLWYRGEGQVSLKDGNKVNISNVCIFPVNESDHGVSFTCRLARDKSVQVSVTLDVEFPPQLSGEETHHIQEGEDVTLTCNSKCNPQAQAVWYKDNNSLTLQQGHHELYQTSEVFQLSIKEVEQSDNGTYTCVVEYFSGKRTRDFHLLVEEKKAVFPKEAVIAAAVVVLITAFFGIAARKDKFCKCFKKSRETAL